MKSTSAAALIFTLIISSFPVHSKSGISMDSESSLTENLEKKILDLSSKAHFELMALSEYKNLKSFCQDDSYRETIFNLLDQIHLYHDLLEFDLNQTPYKHSQRIIKKLLKHMDKLDQKHNPTVFNDFFKDQCSFQSNIEKHAVHYSAAFSSHSYGSRVYAQEVVMYRYLKRLTTRINKIRKHVDHFYVRRQQWEQVPIIKRNR